MMRKRRITAIVFVIIIVFSNFAFAIEEYDKDFGEYKLNYVIDLWHFDTGYWDISCPDGTSKRLYDADVAGSLNLGKNLEKVFLRFKMVVGDDVIEEARKGSTFTAVIMRKTNYDTKYFRNDTSYIEVIGDDLYYCASPMANVAAATMDDYVGGDLGHLNVDLPLLSSSYGNNLYDVYKKSTSSYTYLGTNVGFYDETDKYQTVKGGFIHPKSIKSINGEINSSNMMSINEGRSYTYKNCYVGNGNFVNGGAVGLRFKYVFYLNLYSKTKVVVPKLIYYYHRKK